MPGLTKVDPYRNKSQFLALLGDQEFRNLRPHLNLVSFKAGTVLHMHDETPHYIFFPVDACVSIVTAVQEGRGVEVALIGTEGFVGLWVALGSKANWHEAVVQVPGACLRMRVAPFMAELKRSNSLLDCVHRYARYTLAQISQTAACNRLHRLEQRLARWLLMTQDHAKAPQFVETHEFLSHMLGADRSEVTLAAGILRKSGLITYARGKVKILDRKRLEQVCCECYQVLAEEKLRLGLAGA